MTVCVAVQVNDCIVFAADSASSLVGADAQGNASVTNVYNHGKKVFNLHKGLPIVAMTCGMGNIAGSSIEVIAKDFRGLLMGDDPNWLVDPKNYAIEDVAQKAWRYFFEQQYVPDEFKPEGEHSFEMFIGGFSTNSRFGEIWKISIINGRSFGAQQVAAPGRSGVIWSGQPDAINRLILGYSAKVIPVLQAAGVKEPEISQLLESMQASMQAEMTHPAMPVQDAIHLADFLVATTIGFTKFLPGANTVGGETDLATVTRHEGFKWVRRKHYYPCELNPLETDHVGGR